MTKHHHKHVRHGLYDLNEDLENIKSAFMEAGQHMRGRAGAAISHSLENAKDKSTEFKDSVETYVTKKPLKSLGIALAAGVVLGFLMRK